jgi:dTDP-4-dehydrorhamnose 3,5-epimerase
MKAERLAIPDVILVEPARHADPRGFFSETWSAAPFAELGIGPGFVQDNHSSSV